MRQGKLCHLRTLDERLTLATCHAGTSVKQLAQKYFGGTAGEEGSVGRSTDGSGEALTFSASTAGAFTAQVRTAALL